MKRACLILLWMCTCCMAWAEGEPWIVVKADRTVLYPQHMQLQEEETLMDVLEMYPELLVEGYADVANSYQIRMDNVKMSGEARLLLMQIRAKDVKTVQIVDNPGVAKGTTGLGGVIDITLMPMQPRVQGMAEVQGATDGSAAPTLNLRYASERTNLWLNTQYAFASQEGEQNHTEHLDFHTTTRFSPHDRLLAYVKQDFGHADDGVTLDISRNYLARARYFHTFNDKGTELLSLLGYQHSEHPLRSPGERTSSQAQTPLMLLELNTPLFTPRLSMMLGTEGDYNIYNNGVQQTGMADAETTHRVFNQDFYLQLSYDLGPLKFTMGDRLMLYHYGVSGPSADWRRNTVRNMFQAVGVYQPAQHHQLKAGYYRRFVNPAYLSVAPDALQEEKVQQATLAYTYAARHLTLCAQENYYKRAAGHISRTDVTATWRYKILRATAGVTLHNERSNHHLALRLAPSVALPFHMQVAAKLMYFTPKAHYAQYASTAVYGELRVAYQLKHRWDFQLLGHDLFSSRRVGLMGAVAYRW